MRFVYFLGESLKGTILMYKYLIIILFIIFPVYLFAASNSCSHTVSIRIIPVDNLELQGGHVDFTFYSNRNTNNQNQAVQTDNSCRLKWRILSNERKITVETDNTNSDFELYVRADRVSKGQPAGEVLLNSGGARDFIRGVGRSKGSCELNYKAIAQLGPFEQSVTHHVIYTIVSE